MALQTYWKKRRFDVTAEPRGKVGKAAAASGGVFVIQKHAATRLHYDLRLELDGVMKSWAVTKGPSLVPGEKRLAVHVEDHPIEYNAFEGTIPKGQYGGGTVMIWDRGHWIPEDDPHKGYKKGQLTFRLDGEKLHGSWHLVRMRKRENERQESWLLIKSDDPDARRPSDPDILEEMPRSVVTKRSLDEIAEGRAPRKRAPKVKAAHRTAAASKVAKTNKTKTVRKTKAVKKAVKASARKRTVVRTATAAVDVVRSARVPRSARLPDFIPPCLAKLEAVPPNDANWVHEIKFDGYRLQARFDHGRIKLLTRRGLDWTHKFQPVADALAALPCETALLDGEVVVEDEGGISDFSSLQADLSDGRTDRMRYYAFDCLHLDGSEVAKLPLIPRKTALRRLLKGQDGIVRYSEHYEETGSMVLKGACGLHLEGIVSKRRDASYHSGRTGDWIKTKCADRQEFVVGGYSPSTVSPTMIGALAVGYFENGAFRYAGRIGTGYNQKTARELMQRLKALQVEKPAFADLPREAQRRRDGVWVRPAVVIEVDFRGWTGDRMLRHASFKGIREDKNALEVVREMAMPNTAATTSAKTSAQTSGKRSDKTSATRASRPAARARQVDKAAKTGRAAKRSPDSTIQLTHPERVYWPDVGITKQDLANYWADVWTWIKPHVTRRPLALLRCPDGSGSQCFVQKHAHATFNQGKILRFHDGKEELIAIETLDGLIALAQAGVLEVHVWGSRMETIDLCDRVVFDLDPGPDVKWADVIKATKDLRARFDRLGLESFVKTTGGKGFHVVIPIAGEDWDIVKPFTKALAEQMAADEPDKYVSKMTKSIRKGKIFVDYLRNGRGATAVVAFSPRARPGAPVSTPVAWEEVTTKLTADRFTMLNLKRRLTRLKDPWADIGKVKQKLPPMSALKKL